VTGNTLLGLGAAIGAAVLYGSAPVAQTVAGKRAETGQGVGLRLLLRLAHQWVWLLGFSCEIGAFVLEALAFSAAPATFVAPLMACDMLVFIILGRFAFGARLSTPGIIGAGCMTAGIALLALAFSGDTTLGRPAGNATLIGFLIASVVVAAFAALYAGRALPAGRRLRAAGAFSLASGVTYGLATMATRQVGRTFSTERPWHLLITPTPYVLAVCSVLAIALLQRGLQISPVLTFPLTSAVSAFLPVVLGAALLADQVPRGATLIAFLAALVLLAVGVVLIGRDRSDAEDASDVEAADRGERGKSTIAS
jgi:hypothetical protein